MAASGLIWGARCTATLMPNLGSTGTAISGSILTGICRLSLGASPAVISRAIRDSVCRLVCGATSMTSCGGRFKASRCGEFRGGEQGTAGLLRNPIHVTPNEVKGILTLVESSSREFFAEFTLSAKILRLRLRMTTGSEGLRMTRGDFFNSPNLWMITAPLRLGILASALSQF
jgi:hypothetical protein